MSISMLKLLMLSLFILIATSVAAQDLPKRYVLKQNDAGKYYVVNHENVIMIEPAILKMGFSSRWILACIKHEAIDSDLIRWVFVDLKNRGTTDTLHQENWQYFRDEAYPELKDITLTTYQENENCP